MFIYGKNPVQKVLFEQPNLVKIVYADEKKYADLYKKTTFFANQQIKLFPLNNFNYQKAFPNTNVQGIVAEIFEPEYLNLTEFLKLTNQSKAITVVLLDQVTDPQNFGAIIRNSVAFGIDYLLLSKDNQILLNPVVIKASAGNWFKLKYVLLNSLNSSFKELQRNNFWIITTSLDGDSDLSKMITFDRKVIVFGSEGHGIRKSLLDKSDLKLTIKTTKAIESLNVSSTSAIILHHNFNHQENELSRSKLINKENKKR